jgi:hypothetical protein
MKWIFSEEQPKSHTGNYYPSGHKDKTIIRSIQKKDSFSFPDALLQQ